VTVSSSLPELVVRTRSSVRRRLFYAAAAVLAVLVLLALAYYQGMERAGYVHAEVRAEMETLKARIDNLQGENARLRDTAARAEQQLQIDRTAYQEINDALTESNRRIAGLREEVNFYRNIIAPQDDRRGAQVQELKIEPTPVAGHYRYRVVLIQAYNHKQMVEGRLVLEITGMQGGAADKLRIDRIADKPIEVNFRYFQTVEGEFDLPSGFVPGRVKVSILSHRRDQSAVERAWPWPKG